jgi:hypothetical protein
MKPLVTLFILGSFATSALAAGTDIHVLVDAQAGGTVISQEISNKSPISAYQNALRPAGRYFGRGATGLGHW